MITDAPPRVLATKILPPRSAPGLIDRPRLLDLINQVQIKRLTVIKAAAGFGKTCLAAAWAERLQQSGNSVAWLSLDDDDDEPSRFLFNIAQVLQKVCAGVGEPALGLIHEIFLLRPQTIVSTLINNLADVDDEVYLFLDDYQWATHRGVHDAMSFLLRHAPPNFHLVITTRSEPPLPLARLRAQNQLLEIDGPALRFDFDEMGRFLEQEKLGGLTPAELSTLQEKTEGWPAVMRIVVATSSLAGQKFGHYVPRLTGASRPINYYLSEMLESLPGDTVQFMLRTAILDRLSAPLCQAVTGERSSQDLLLFIANKQLLLTPLDHEGAWYRFHALLREHLRNRLDAEFPDEVPELHRRAYRWYASQELWMDAVQHATAAGDKTQAIGWIERCAMMLVKRGDLLPLLGWQRLLPTELMRSQIAVRLAIAWGMALAMRFEEALQLVADIERDGVGESAPKMEAFQCECNTIRAVAFALSDDSQAARSLAEACLTRRPSDPWTANVASNVARFAHWRGGDLVSFYAAPWTPFSDDENRRNVFATVYRLCLQGLVEFDQLRPAEAERHYLEALRVAEQHVGSSSVATSLPASLLAQIRCDQGRFDEAEDLVIDRIPIIDATGMLECVLQAYLALVRVARHRGNIGRCHALLEQADNLGQARGWGRLVAAVLLERLRLYCAEGRSAEASACVARLAQLALEYPASARCAWSDIHDYAALARARLASAQHRFQDSVAVLRRLHQEALAAQRHYVALRLATQLSLALLGANQSAEASSIFCGVLAVAAPVDLSGPVLDGGPEVLTLLLRFRDSAKQSVRVHELLPHANDLIARCREYYPSEPSQGRDSAIADPLTPRESSVLELLSEGESNKDVARALGIAPETVKSHVKSIFEKLGVERRTQAISRARGLGLIKTN
jgi:ATP/maltotriose-dependent transcriptional regulator MalT